MRPKTKARSATSVLISLVCLHAGTQEKVMRLCDGPAPGSEQWERREEESRTNLWRTRVVFNVTEPTHTLSRPEQDKANGTADTVRHAKTTPAQRQLD